MNDTTKCGAESQMPNEIEAEKAILAAALVDPSTVPTLADLLCPEDFYVTAHQNIMMAIYQLMSDGATPDTSGILGRLADAGHIKNGLGAYLGKLMDFPAAVDIAGVAARIKKAAARRQIITKANELMQRAQADADIESIRRKVNEAFASIELALDEPHGGWKHSTRPPAIRGMRIMRGLDCCVRLIAHTGKGNAREKSLDQYTSRGGSALSDGARMVAVLQAWKPGDNLRPPPGCVEAADATLTILARPKLSYAAPQPLIWIRRTGWAFEHFIEFSISDEERERALFDQVERFLAAEVNQGHRHNITSLETAIPGTKRADAREAIDQLMVRGRIVEVDLPPGEQKTKRKSYLAVSAPDRLGEIRQDS